MRRGLILALLIVFPIAAANAEPFSGTLLGPSADLFAFTAADEAVIRLDIDAGREVGIGTIFLFDSENRMIVSSGQALNGDVEVFTAPFQYTMTDRSGGSGTIVLKAGSRCADSCKVIVSGEGDIDRIDYSLGGVNASILPLASRLRTFFSDGYRPSEGFAAGASAQYNHVDAQVFAHETLHIAGSPVIVGGAWTDVRSYYVSTGNMTITSPDGEVMTCCHIGDLNGHRAGDYQIDWTRVEGGEYPDGLYFGVDVVLPS